MTGFLEYFDKRNQRLTEFENDRLQRRSSTAAADIGFAAVVWILLRWLIVGLTNGTLTAVLGAVVTFGWLAFALFVAVRAWIRYRRDKRAWTTEYPLTP